ncbi:KR domain-containing protein [Daldinia sp. FL1419]|nr:KR domain-containing protein [Daldinia sp. FL1419]
MTVHFSAGAKVPLMRAPLPPLRLDPTAACILAGGLGSLGLRVADLLAESGARHLIFLWRSGGSRYERKLERSRAQGCMVSIIKCDITSLNNVQDIGAEVAKLNKPVKRVFQLAMVLQMTYDQWCAAFGPKVARTWNSHTGFPKEVDFFFMLSSVVSIIGNVAQANYAVGNSYMDAFAHYRRSLGLRAVSINAGLVTDSEHIIGGIPMRGYLDCFKYMASVSATLEELDIGITAAMRGATADGQPIAPQFAFCMTDSLQPDGVDQWAKDPKFSHRVAVIQDQSTTTNLSGPSIGEALNSATSLFDAVQLIQDMLKSSLAPGLGVQPRDINENRPPL